MLPSIWKDWNPCTLLVQMENGAIANGKQYGGSKKIKCKLSKDSAILLLGEELK